MNPLTTYESTKKRLEKIFRDRFGIDLDSCNSDILNQNLLGSKFRMEARDLLYLFFDVEKEFGITIPEEAIVTGKFSSFNDILDIIVNCCVA